MPAWKSFSAETQHIWFIPVKAFPASLPARREGPRSAGVAHQAQLVHKLTFLFSEPGLAPARIPTIIAILGWQLRGHFSVQDLLRYCARGQGKGRAQAGLPGAVGPALP